MSGRSPIRKLENANTVVWRGGGFPGEVGRGGLSGTGDGWAREVRLSGAGEFSGARGFASEEGCRQGRFWGTEGCQSGEEGLGGYRPCNSCSRGFIKYPYVYR